jgi:hypothetical protein
MRIKRRGLVELHSMERGCFFRIHEPWATPRGAGLRPADPITPCKNTTLLTE